jgi:hypothetical protein
VPEDDSSSIGAHVDLAWQEFLAEMDRLYPVADWLICRCWVTTGVRWRSRPDVYG